MRPLSPNDVRRMVREAAAPYGQQKLWAELHGISSNHLSNFMQGWCGVPPGVMETLGIVKVMVLAADLPEGSKHDDGKAWRRPAPPKRKRIEDENPMA